jgi:hypothetical protein
MVDERRTCWQLPSAPTEMLFQQADRPASRSQRGAQVATDLQAVAG